MEANVGGSTPEVKKGVSYATQVAQAREIVKTGQLDGALQNLLALEKVARLAADVAGTTELVTAMVEICYEAKDWPRLSETISMLSKRRAQLKQAVGAMVQLASKWVEELTDEEAKLQLIETLRAVSEGKMFVEVDRARLTKMLATIHESKGDLAQARIVMCDTVVETLGGMDKREKTDFILEQVRLCLDTSDYIRANIMSKKINVKVFKDTELEDLKIRYYTMIVRYHKHMSSDHKCDWMEIFRAYQAMWNSPSLQSDEAAAHRCLKLQVIYLLLSAYDSEQSSEMHAVAQEKMLAQLPSYQKILNLFITKEIFQFGELRGMLDSELTALGIADAAERSLMLDDLHMRVTQHNLQVVSGYYARIGMTRLAELLALPVAQAEEQLVEMVCGKQLYARIDRPAGIITFSPPKPPEQLLNDWSSDISQLLNLLEGTCHLIHKENMVHRIDAK